eukprot:COSAG01_NODE_1097_length_11708_cov_5.617743_3_plen_142_part_00
MGKYLCSPSGLRSAAHVLCVVLATSKVTLRANANAFFPPNACFCLFQIRAVRPDDADWPSDYSAADRRFASISWGPLLSHSGALAIGPHVTDPRCVCAITTLRHQCPPSPHPHPRWPNALSSVETVRRLHSGRERPWTRTL